MDHLYRTKFWNFLRRNTVGTHNVDYITSISNGCRKPEYCAYCYHNITYIYNGLEQKEEFSSADIVRLCKNLGYSLSPHFSEESWMKDVALPVVLNRQNSIQPQMEPIGHQEIGDDDSPPKDYVSVQIIPQYPKMEQKIPQYVQTKII